MNSKQADMKCHIAPSTVFVHHKIIEPHLIKFSANIWLPKGAQLHQHCRPAASTSFKVRHHNLNEKESSDHSRVAGKIASMDQISFIVAINDYQWSSTISPMMSAMGVVSRMFWPLCCTRFWRLATKSSLRHVFSMGTGQPPSRLRISPMNEVVHDIRGSTARWTKSVFHMESANILCDDKEIPLSAVFPLSYVGLVISPYTQVQI